MGNFFTSIQIHNPEQLSKEQFIELFCNKMRENGFVVGNADDHEISYALSFADNCKWVAIGSESYEQGNAATQKDAGNIAKMLNACCINITVVDSDCAMLDMYSNAGYKLDTAVIGRADDCLGDNIPAPIKETWEYFFTENSSWKQFNAIQNCDYTFVEDALTELAPLLGMDSRNILFDAKDASESDENTCFLYFKKSSTKKLKKLTLNAAFKQVFGETLEPLGFVKAKTKYPYYLRVINNEIIHIIGMIGGSDGLSIVSGVATVYRMELTLNRSHRFNGNWLRSISEFYEHFDPYTYDNDYYWSIHVFRFSKYEEGTMINAVKKALNETEKWILPVLNNINTLYDVIDYLYKFKIHDGLEFYTPYDVPNKIREALSSDGSLLFALDNPYSFFDRRIELAKERSLYETEHNLNNFTKEDYEKNCDLICSQNESRKTVIHNIIINKEYYDKTLSEINQRKIKNIKILRSYGLNL